jgi:peptidoglycan/LPS O-acetylase OafA/YrhL
MLKDGYSDFILAFICLTSVVSLVGLWRTRAREFRVRVKWISLMGGAIPTLIILIIAQFTDVETHQGAFVVMAILAVILVVLVIIAILERSEKRKQRRMKR